MLRKSKILPIGVFLFCVMAFPVSSGAGDGGVVFPGGYHAYSFGDRHAAQHDFFGSYPNRYGRRYLRNYYFAYPYEEKSPYQNLLIRPAGELHLMVSPSRARVFVDGYEVEKEDERSYTIGLLTGAHSVKVIAEGYKPHCEEVQIEKGKKKAISVKLTQ